MEENKIYMAIDLKSFYASVECLDRGLDPMTTNLVVADASRTKKTICLAVSPSLKSYGIPGRPRLFEVISKVQEVNARRQNKSPNRKIEDVSYIVAPPRMKLYLEYSTWIYKIYLKYIAPEDIHVYSIDEVFIDITNYFRLYKLKPYEMAKMIVQDVLKTTGVTATVGIGTNLYLAKVAMDIKAKNIRPDKDGCSIAQLDEITYREFLWTHKPITDFWRVGKGYASKLEKNGIHTMGDVARVSIGKANEYYNEDLLYNLFGVNAELLIDHAWGHESCTIADIKAYKPKSKSLGSGQVLHKPYNFYKAKLIAKEMVDLLVLDLVDKKLVTDQIVLKIGYDIENLNSRVKRQAYKGQVKTDTYGRKVPKHGRGTINLKEKTSSASIIMDGLVDLFDRIVDKSLLIRRVTINFNNVVAEDSIVKKSHEQLDMFLNLQTEKEREEGLERERRLQETVINLKKKYGKNAILKGMNLEEGATTIDRNKQIGGHKA